jgi:RHS repeat-associated protein
MKGIGETFSPDLFTGTGNFSVPIQCPAGRNGFQPQLSLTYSTGQGNGPFGLGWNLSIPGVTRQTARGIPRYNGEDVFVLSGAEDLVLVSPPGTTPRRYRPRTEGLFAAITHVSDLTQDYWEVKSKDGLVSIYGDLPGVPEESAVIADPESAARKFSWKLARTTDLFGNKIQYSYVRDPVRIDGPHQWDQIYLKEIRYVEYVESGEERFLYRIRFAYEPRPDPFSDCRAGFEVRTVQRCRRIDVLFDDGAERGVRSYELAYAGDSMSDDVPPNGVSLLQSIGVVGYDDGGARGTKELPPLEFCYSEFRPEQKFGDYHRDLKVAQGADLPASSLANPACELVDLFGNGLPDILEMGGVARYWQNQGGGFFSRPRIMDAAPGGILLADPGVQLLDADGDGRTDLFTMNHPLAGYYPLTFSGEWDSRRSFQRYRKAPSISFADPEVKLIDLDGDGLTDVLRSGTRFECFFNDRRPDQAWQRMEPHERGSLEAFPNVSFSDPRVRTADMTGDGMQDIVFFHERSVEYWSNLGHGRWGRRIRMRPAPNLPYDYDPGRVFLGDLDGDGLADLVYVEDGCVLLWINQSGNGWSNCIKISGTPPMHNLAHVRLVDFLGNGTSGILWSYDVSAITRETMYFLDLTGGAKPYLLHEMNNHMGAVTRVHYAPSTRFFLEDEKHLERRWRTKLPFPVQVVSRVEVIDEISRGKLTTQFHYSGGYWSGVDREFRGFSCVAQSDTETFEDYHRSDPLHGDQPFDRFDEDPNRQKHFAPPTLTRTWFHLGALDEATDGLELDLSNEYWQGDPSLLHHHESPDSVLLTPSLPLQDKRDAIRTLRGSVLRTELYALDGSSREAQPYTVTESCYSVREVARESSPSPGSPPRLIAFPHLDVQRTTQWERGDDPMTQFAFTRDYDVFGQPKQQTAVALPRRAANRQSAIGAVIGAYQPDEIRILASHTRTLYVSSPIGKQIHNRVAQVKAYELNNPPNGPDLAGDDSLAALRSQYAAARQVDHKFQLLAPGSTQVFSHTINHYDGPAFDGLPVGQLKDFGALTRTESLVLTDSLLDAAYGNRRPDYLGGASALPTVLAGFGTRTGYRGVATDGSGYEDGWYVDSQRSKYDFQTGAGAPRGLIAGLKDPLGNETSVRHDRFSLLPVEVTDAAGLVTRAEHNYRVQQPNYLEDSNGTTTHLRYSPIGLPQKQFVRRLDAAGTEAFGGNEAQPEMEFEYGFRAFTDSPPSARKAIFVHARRRIHHASDNLSDETIESREFSDGFGRLIQTRGQAEDWIFGVSGDDVGLPTSPGADTVAAVTQQISDCVVVSGWQKFDNKGRAIEKYEAFFSQGWDFEPYATRGEHATMSYDPRGNMIRTLNPDGSEQRVILGRPVTPTGLTLSSIDLESGDVPDSFEPSPWETYSYDANDLAPLTHASATGVPASHYFTPASGLIDALGHALCQVQRNGNDSANDWFVIRTDYDLRGNVMRIIDAHGRDAFKHSYDLLNRPLRVDSIDAGLRTSVVDARGNLIEYRDSKDGLVLRTYDEVNRPREIWARNDDAGRFSLRERFHYGDDGDRALARSHNTLGRLVKHYDEAGLLEMPDYDFKGNLLEKARRTIEDDRIAIGWQAKWEKPNAEDALESTTYQTSSRYDALDRPTEVSYPQDMDGERKKLIFHYNRAGVLDSVALGGADYVRRIAYNAKGQRLLVVYGNGVMTRYAYNPLTFRLIRLRTDRLDEAGFVRRFVDLILGGHRDTITLETTGSAIQDFAYTYDLAGNITTIDERTPRCGFSANSEALLAGDAVLANLLNNGNALMRRFEYDPVYRLTSATGRACRDIGSPRGSDDDPRCGYYAGGAPTTTQDNAPFLTEGYTERYMYDPAGNMLELFHQPGSGVPWKRVFGMADLPDDRWKDAHNNRLTSLRSGTIIPAQSYRFDANGNLIQQNTERHHTWDHADRMVGYRVQPNFDSPASIEARYLYAADGLRVKKWVRNQAGQVTTTTYIDDIFEHNRLKTGSENRANNTLHVMDNQNRIALVRVGPPLDGREASPQVQYHLSDHVGGSHVVVGGDDAWANSFVNREEYFPYGETSFGSFGRKRYRYGGKEIDESGLYYFGARYLAPWLSRWVSSDPAGYLDELNGYLYAGLNPIFYSDNIGLAKEPWDIIEKVVLRARKKLDEGGAAINHHVRRRHDQGRTEWPNRTKLKKPGTSKKLSVTTLRSYDRVSVQVEDGRYLFQKKFGRALSEGGETVYRVVIDPRTGEVVTAFASEFFNKLPGIAGGMVALAVLDDSLAQAQDIGDRMRPNGGLDRSILLDIGSMFVPDLLDAAPLSDGPDPNISNDLAKELVARMQHELGQTLDSETQGQLHMAIDHALYGFPGDEGDFDDIPASDAENSPSEQNNIGLDVIERR